MKIRTLAVAAGACVVLLAAGCSSTAVAGRAEIASGAVLAPTSNSAPSPFPDPTGGESDTSASSAATSTDENSSATDTPESSSTDQPSTASTDSSSSSTTGSSSQADDTSVPPTPVTSIPGLSKDCNAVLAGITAFSTLLQTATGGGSISQAAVDQALAQLPETGLPARPQADITVLRTTISGAAGKSLADLSKLLADGQVVDALKDLSSWAGSNCG